VLDQLSASSSQSGGALASRYVSLPGVVGVSAAEIASGLQALAFIFRVLLTSNSSSQPLLSHEQVGALLQRETDLSDARRGLLARLWSDYAKTAAGSALSSVSRALSLGRLVRLSWRVGVSIGTSFSDAAADASALPAAPAPFVTLAFEIALPAGAQGGSTAAAALAGSSGSVAVAPVPLAGLGLLSAADSSSPSTTSSPANSSSSISSAGGSTRTFIVECSHHEFSEVRKHFHDLFAQLDAI
jgi:hypothetical protein